MPCDSHLLAVIETLYAFLDRSPFPILLLDAYGRIVFVNERAAALDQGNDGISLSGGTLTLADTADHARLRHLIAQALAGEDGAMQAPRLSGARPYGIVVSPLAEQRQSAIGFRPAVCVVLTGADARQRLPVHRLRDVFGLTDAEARLAVLLAGGEDLRCAARQLGITYGTARARLAEIFQKTGTGRQGQLVNLLLTTITAV